jgi:predicted amidohydrolase YtcJ
VAIKNGRFIAVGSDRDVRPFMGSGTRVIDLGGRTVVPGLIDSHIHATVAGLSWDAELHWEHTRTLSDGVGQIAARAKSTPAGSWIVVGGGWVPTQFGERRFPTRAELDAIAPSHPVYVQYLRQGALLNSAALKTLGITAKSPDPSGGKFERNPNTGELTGWLQGVAAWEYAYNKIPNLPLDRMRQSLRNCFRELNRLGVTSAVDIQTSGVTFAHRRLLADMARTGELSVRLSFYVAPNDPGDELEQLKRTAAEVSGLARGDVFRFAGFAGNLVAGIGDDDSLSSPKDITISADAKEKFRQIARYSAETGQRLHLDAGQNHTARQLLDVLEAVHAATPFAPQQIVFAHLEEAAPETISRIKNLGAGIAVRDRLVLTGEGYAELSGLAKARNAPPLRAMIAAGVPLGGGTDGFLASNYSPMLSLWWLVTGKTVAGSAIRDKNQNITRAEALRMYTIGSAALTGEERRKGSIEVDKFADLAVLNADYLTVPEDQIRSLESLLTMVGGRIVYSARPFTH